MQEQKVTNSDAFTSESGLSSSNSHSKKVFRNTVILSVGVVALLAIAGFGIWAASRNTESTLNNDSVNSTSTDSSISVESTATLEDIENTPIAFIKEEATESGKTYTLVYSPSINGPETNIISYSSEFSALLSPSGRKLAYKSFESSTVKVVDLETMQTKEVSFPTIGYLSSWSPDDKIIIVAQDESERAINIETAESVLYLTGARLFSARGWLDNTKYVYLTPFETDSYPFFSYAGYSVAMYDFATSQTTVLAKGNDITTYGYAATSPHTAEFYLSTEDNKVVFLKAEFERQDDVYQDNPIYKYTYQQVNLNDSSLIDITNSFVETPEHLMKLKDLAEERKEPDQQDKLWFWYLEVSQHPTFPAWYLASVNHYATRDGEDSIVEHKKSIYIFNKDDFESTLTKLDYSESIKNFMWPEVRRVFRQNSSD